MHAVQLNCGRLSTTRAEVQVLKLADGKIFHHTTTTTTAAAAVGT